jgi:hypothetical protein
MLTSAPNSMGSAAEFTRGEPSIRAPLTIARTHDGAREPVAFGAPAAKGVLLNSPQVGQLVHAGGDVVSAQSRPTAWWSDGSIKWLHVDAALPAFATGKGWEFVATQSATKAAPQSPDQVHGERCFPCGPALLAFGDASSESPGALHFHLGIDAWTLTDHLGQRQRPARAIVQRESSGPLTSTVVQSCEFPGLKGLRLTVRWTATPRWDLCAATRLSTTRAEPNIRMACGTWATPIPCCSKISHSASD